MAVLNGVTIQELARDNVSPTMAFRHDAITCRRSYTCAWTDFADAIVALRGNTQVSTDGRSFSRNPLPHHFKFQTMLREFVCMDASEGKGAGMPRKTDGTIDPTNLNDPSNLSQVFDSNIVGLSDKAHIAADYYVSMFSVIADDDTNDPINSGDGTEPLPWDEWDRFTEWNIEFSTETLSVPGAAYRYVNITGNPPVTNAYIQIPIISAKVSAKIYSLPQIPPAALQFEGCVNHKDFSFYLQPVDAMVNGGQPQLQMCKAETLLFLSSKTDERNLPDGSKAYDITYYFSYRPNREYVQGSGMTDLGQNALLYYNPSTKQVTFQQVAVNTANRTADGSAIFRLRNFGYLWSPRDPRSDGF